MEITTLNSIGIILFMTILFISFYFVFGVILEIFIPDKKRKPIVANKNSTLSDEIRILKEMRPLMSTSDFFDQIINILDKIDDEMGKRKT